ncbi:MAG TPA: heme-binding protein [Chloroflexota bacterium]
MYQRTTLGLDDAQRAIAAGLAEAQRDGRPMAVAVVDANGDLISCVRMDGAHERILRFALRKAYTAATMARDTLAFKAELVDRQRTLADYGDQQFTTLQGGVPVSVGGQVVGAVAVGGATLERDKEIAEITAAAILTGLKS